ncbi:hypothetical protein, partial [Caulobacter sp. 17J65-9]|uniref:hypothetical protein n=1 Tax=Caulobacter sp. 17J65-9 TaxID=2709382 RepID=UPI0013C8BD75
PRAVLAFYYGWWGLAATSGARRHWGPPDGQGVAGAAHFPQGGLYDSRDPDELVRQLAVARAAGIDGFIASWWGRGGFEDGTLGLLLRAAERAPFKVSAYYETSGAGPRAGEAASARIAADLDWLARRHMTSPAWLTVEGRPVLFAYERVLEEVEPQAFADAVARVAAGGGPRLFTVGPAEFAQTRPERAPFFDALHAYSVVRETHEVGSRRLSAAAERIYRQQVAAAGSALACVSVSPGYDDREMPGRPDPRQVLKRRDGATYRVLWDAAIRAWPDWVLITSWNEWHEATEIEPSVENGGRELETTREMAGRFRTA